MTIAIARACPFIPHRSRNSFVRSVFTDSPPHLPRGFLPFVPLHGLDDPRPHAHHPVRPPGDVRVVGDQRRGGPELPVGPLKHFTHDAPGGGVQRTRRLVPPHH